MCKYKYIYIYVQHLFGLHSKGNNVYSHNNSQNRHHQIDALGRSRSSKLPKLVSGRSTKPKWLQTQMWEYRGPYKPG